jgi:hypothetical protein
VRLGHRGLLEHKETLVLKELRVHREMQALRE